MVDEAGQGSELFAAHGVHIGGLRVLSTHDCPTSLWMIVWERLWSGMKVSRK